MKTDGQERDNKTLTTEEAAKEWNISKKAIYSLVRSGKLKPIINLGKSWRFLSSDFNDNVFIRL